MRTGLFAFAAAAIIAVAIPVSAPASAEEIGVHAGENGVGVRVGGDHHREGWREGRGDHCRTVIVKHRTPDGNVVVRKTRHCD